MATWWKSQQGEGEYSLQFETNSKKRYKLVEKAAQMAVDGKTADDIVEVARGEWEEYCFVLVDPFNEGFPAVKCSVCGIAFCDIINNHKYMYNFCPNCGADMRSKNNE